MSAASRFFSGERLHRLLAAGGAALVFALTIFAASPRAHDSLHAAGASHHDDRCAVVLFAGGVSLPIEAPTVEPPLTLAREIATATTEEIFLVSPRYLRQPERGPPDQG